MIRILCLALAIAVATGKLTFNECGKGEVKDLTITDCSEAPCTFHPGKNYTISVVFTANENSNKVKFNLVPKTGELELLIPGIETDACKFMTCPLKKGETVTMNYKLNVPAIDMGMLLFEFKARLIGDKGELACGKLPGYIKK